MSRTMAAMQMVDYNKPLEIKQVPVPEVHGEEVLVRVQASGLCHSDLHLIHGSLKLIRGFPHTLGHENAGAVEEVGEGVSGFKKGDPVVVYGGWSRKSDRFSLTGQEQLTNPGDWAGIGQPGGYAEYMKVPTNGRLQVSAAR